MGRAVLIDGDILAYTAAASVQYNMDWGNGTYTSFGDVGEAKMLVGAKIDSIVNSFGGIEAVICLSCDGHYWRHDIMPTYKGTRTLIKPVVLGGLREEMAKVWGAVIMPKLEADDVLGILATSGEYDRPILYSQDKDLDTIPCLRAKEPGVVYEVSPTEADWNHLRMSFTGDPTDGFKGCPGVGVKTADKILAGADTLSDGWMLIVERYAKAGMTPDEALLQAQVARVLRAGDYDQEVQAVRLWNPPT